MAARARRRERYPDLIPLALPRPEVGQGDGARKLEVVWTVEMRRKTRPRCSSVAIEQEISIPRGPAAALSVDKLDGFPSSFPLDRTGRSQHKFTFTTSFSIGPTFPAPDGSGSLICSMMNSRL